MVIPIDYVIKCNQRAVRVCDATTEEKKLKLKRRNRPERCHLKYLNGKHSQSLHLTPREASGATR